MSTVKDVVNAIQAQEWFEKRDIEVKEPPSLMDLEPLFSGLLIDKVSVKAVFQNLTQVLQHFFDETRTEECEARMKSLFYCLAYTFRVFSRKCNQIIFGGFILDRISRYEVPEEFDILFGKLLVHWSFEKLNRSS